MDVKPIQEYITVNIKEANAELVAQMKALTWLIGVLGSVIAIGTLLSALSPLIGKLGH